MAANRGRHAAIQIEGDPDEERGAWHVHSAKALLWAGRVLPLATVAAVVWSRLRQESWASAPLDDAGFTTAFVPNLAVGLSFVMGMALPLVVLPVGSSVLAAREADRLFVRTVLGRRTVDLASATAWRARLPGQGHGIQVVSVRSRRGWVVLMASELWLDADYTFPGGLVGADPPHDTSRWWLSVRGWALLVLWVLMIFVVAGAGTAVAGL